MFLSRKFELPQNYLCWNIISRIVAEILIAIFEKLQLLQDALPSGALNVFKSIKSIHSYILRSYEVKSQKLTSCFFLISNNALILCLITQGVAQDLIIDLELHGA